MCILIFIKFATDFQINAKCWYRKFAFGFSHFDVLLMQEKKFIGRDQQEVKIDLSKPEIIPYPSTGDNIQQLSNSKGWKSV